MMRTQLAQYCSLVEARRILKLTVVITVVGDSHSHLKRLYTRTVEGFSIFPTLVYKENIIKYLDLKSAKGVGTSGTAKHNIDFEEGNEPLDEHRRETFVSSAQRALILSLDRRDVVCVVKSWTRRVKDPVEERSIH